MTTVPVHDQAQVRAAVSLADAITSVETALRAHASAQVTSPSPWHLDLPDVRGEVHVKGAHLHGAPTFAVKTSAGFPGNAARDLPTSSGMTAVYDATTGALRALLLDGGYLTELRTGAAGAVAAGLLAPRDVDTAVVVGTGGQAHHQVAGLLAVRRPSRLVVVGRDAERARRFAEEVAAAHDLDVDATTAAETAVARADVVVTVTNARQPVVLDGWVRPGAHVTAVGSDGPGKRELDPALLLRADVVAVDDLEQSRTLGELQGIALDDLRSPPVLLGTLLDERPDRDPEAVTVADLSGLGAQDAAIAALALARLAPAATTA